MNHHKLKISNTRYIENVFANVPHKLNRPEDDRIVLDQEVNVLIWGLLMSTTMRAAMHLGENYKDNLFTCRNTNHEALKALFDITQKLILNQNHEIMHVSTIEWRLTSRMRYTLQHDKVSKLPEAKVHVYSDSALCLGKMHRHRDCHGNAKGQLQHCHNVNEHKELFGFDGEPFQLEWNIIPGHTTVEIILQIQARM